MGVCMNLLLEINTIALPYSGYIEWFSISYNKHIKKDNYLTCRLREPECYLGLFQWDRWYRHPS